MRRCDLCALPVGEKPFTLRVGERELQFCCEGCLGIYQMIHDLRDNGSRADCDPRAEKHTLQGRMS